VAHEEISNKTAPIIKKAIEIDLIITRSLYRLCLL